MVKIRTQFCIECRKKTEYKIEKTQCTYCIRGKEYTFDILKAVCEECGEEVNLPGLMDNNAKQIDKQYRKIEELVTIDDIQTLMNIYNIGKAPVSLALGFGEITVTRYLQGQYPSEEYSAVIRKALTSPDYMMSCLETNKEKVGEAAYKKAWSAAKDLSMLLNSVSEKMLITISYIFEKANEVTPLALQKLLYYIQGIYMVNFSKTLFPETCQAWEHGPVYATVYEMFKGFKYNPIDDKRFIIFKDRFQKLSEEEKRVIDMVLNTFGLYSGKVLERLTHRESPWSDAYSNDRTYEYTNEVIMNESIMEYFESIAREYDLKTEAGLLKYIRKQLV